jgi:hypothetical protein
MAGDREIFDGDYWQAYRVGAHKCDVVDQFCLAPPQGASWTRAECFACGNPVCPNCSVLISYYDYGRKRVCHRCVCEHFGHEDPRPMAHLERLAKGKAA